MWNFTWKFLPKIFERENTHTLPFPIPLHFALVHEFLLLTFALHHHLDSIDGHTKIEKKLVEQPIHNIFKKNE